MAGSAILSIKILTDTSKAQAGLDQTSSKVGKVQGTLSKMVVPAAVAGAAVVAFGKACVDSASRTQQAMGAVDTVFGRSAGTVKRWASQAADSVGLAKSEYGELASTLGASLKNMGVPMSDLAGQTNTLIKLGADLSATYGGTTKDAVDALGSALRGETDPIERYGISIKQATIAAEMAREGTDKLTGAAATQAHTQALLTLVTKQSGKAVGAFAREADTAAGQQQRNAAAWENARSAIGTAFLPMVTAAAKALAVFGTWAAKNAATVRILMVVVGGLAAAILAANVALKAYATVTELVGVVSKATWLSNPVFLVVAAVIALGVAIVVLYKRSKTFRTFVDSMWRGIKAGAAAAAKVVRAVWGAAIDAVRSYLAVWRAYFVLVFNVVRSIVRAVVAVFRGDWRGALDAVRSIVAAFRDFFRSVFNALPDPVRKVISAIRDGVGGAIRWLVDKLKPLGAALASPFTAMWDALQRVIDAVESLIGWLGKIHIPDLGGLVSKIPGLGMAAAPTVAAPGVTVGRDPQLRGTRAARPGASGGAVGPTIVVQGALDPEAVARQIRRILTSHDRRVGSVSVR